MPEEELRSLLLINLPQGEDPSRALVSPSSPRYLGLRVRHEIAASVESSTIGNRAHSIKCHIDNAAYLDRGSSTPKGVAVPARTVTPI